MTPKRLAAILSLCLLPVGCKNSPAPAPLNTAPAPMPVQPRVAAAQCTMTIQKTNSPSSPIITGGGQGNISFEVENGRTTMSIESKADSQCPNGHSIIVKNKDGSPGQSFHNVTGNITVITINQ